MCMHLAEVYFVLWPREKPPENTAQRTGVLMIVYIAVERSSGIKSHRKKTDRRLRDFSFYSALETRAALFFNFLF